MRLLISLVSSLDFAYWVSRHYRTSTVPMKYLSSTSPSSQTTEELYKSHHNDKYSIVCYGFKSIDLFNFNIITWLNYFTCVSARLLPVLRLGLVLPLRFQGLGTDGMVSSLPDRLFLLYFISLPMQAELLPFARGINTLCVNSQFALNLMLPLRLQGLGTGYWLGITRQDFPTLQHYSVTYFYPVSSIFNFFKLWDLYAL